MPETDIKKGRIVPVEIESEMKKSFIEYAMSVIVDRALPDVRDGLKPVHRRILYAMYMNNFTPDKPFRKCATTVGDVLGKFHPHGDAAVYETMVRMAQDFSMRDILIEGHGNFGSRDGDSPAAMRYTEARLSKIAMMLLDEINKDTVEFKPNFDEHEVEPVVLPAKFPNLLVNGSSGIAVGMATNIPTHNLGEVIDATVALIDDPEMEDDRLINYIQGPDFPTGAVIMGKKGIREAIRTGRGQIVVRAVAEIEEHKKDRYRIIVKELPYQVNNARLVEKIADLVKEKKIDGISDLRDEYSNKGIRIVIELKKDANANVVLNQLYKHTPMQDYFNVNMLAVVQNDQGKYEPKQINYKQALMYYIKHQKDVIRRRTRFELEKALASAHILEGKIIAINNLDEVIRIIRAAENENAAKQKLSERFELSEKQAQAIVDMRLGTLTRLKRVELDTEYAELIKKIEYYRGVLDSEKLIEGIIKEELLGVKEKFATPRLTQLATDTTEIEDEDLIQEEEVAITLTHFGYVKRISSDEYCIQKRGGKGKIGIVTREEDFVETLFTTSTHNYLLFFTNKGRVYSLKAYEIPEAGRQAKGMAIVNLLQLEPGEKVSAVIPVSEFLEGFYIIIGTRDGIIKKTKLMSYSKIRLSGIIGITLKDNDELIDVKLTDGNKDIMMVTRNGQSIRFPEKEVRDMGRASMGVKGIELNAEDYVIGMSVVSGNEQVLIVTEKGFGKRTDVEEYRPQSRNGKGILTYRVTERTGRIAGMKLVNDEDDIFLISADGSIIRLECSSISLLGRATQGVTLKRMGENDYIVDIARVLKEIEEDEADDTRP
jgi:DNA gyrase subunit A